jgi:glycosyltransferase involved in cell wall biosynthesis
MKNLNLSIIVPCYNEQEVISICYQKITEVLKSISDLTYEIIFVNDGSKDNTLSILQQIQSNDERIKTINFSRNFGKEAGTTAGLDASIGDAVVIIDADLQDPPLLIKDMLKKWKDGYDVVYAKRIEREGETWFKKFTAKYFYKIINKMGPVEMPENVGDFRLMDRKVVNILKELPERHRFMKGLFAWVGFKSIAIPYVRDARHAGTTKWNYWKLWNFALEGIFGYTIFPIQLPFYLGIFISIFSLLSLFFIYSKIVSLIFLFFGLQFIFIGLLGEYVGRIFNEVKQRPIYILDNEK